MQGLAWYLRQMPEVLAGQLTMEKTPGYFHTAGVPRRMWQTNNATKLILILREPVSSACDEVCFCSATKLVNCRSDPAD